MPTNYQAQVKMTPKTKANRVVADSVALAPSLSNDAIAKQANSPRLRGPQKILDYPASELKSATNEPAKGSPFVRKQGSRTAAVTYALAKRLFDLVLGFVLFLIAVPIVLIAALAIRVNTPGSPFFFQTRLGKNGKPFKIFKLRGMYIDARTRFPTYYDYSKKQDLEFCFHHEEDPRVTRAGKFIRKTSIDELPNLWNVVLGDMSLVGPRPEIPEVMALYGPYRDEYLSVKPGVTCLSKCTGRDRLTKRETIEFDLDYIRRRSFSLDFKILWQTFRGVVLRRDVF
jgi:lipopolysaccharide/colanic/teichoic acid biosynthesis glycosyltransferase